jgi:glycosyltransferase involved in cell wall biosynthesis
MPCENVQVIFVPEVAEHDIGGFFSSLHLYGSRILDALREHYGDIGPDLIEFSDYLGEGAVTVQARRAGEPFLRNTVVGVRLHTSAELCAILDGHIDQSFPAQITCGLERLAIRDADYLIWPGGDTLAFYRRFYGGELVAPGWRIRNPISSSGDGPPPERVTVAEADQHLRLLYLGRLERRKGVQNLIRAVNYIDSEHLQVSLLGGDTDTAPLGSSMGASLRLMAGGDPRVIFLDPVPRSEMAEVIRSSDVVVLPSLWEAWPYVGLEALRLNRPLLATPTGGFTEMVRRGASGWLTADTTPTSLASLISELLFRRQDLAAMRSTERAVEHFTELTDPLGIRADYQAMLETRGRWRTSGRGTRSRSVERSPRTTEANGRPQSVSVAAARPPIVSIVIPYYRLANHIEETVRSALGQTHSRIEVIVVNDGSALEGDAILGELASRYPIAIITQLNSGLGAARNFGIRQAHGRYVVPLDADNVLEPRFVERALDAMECEPQTAYVTAWSRYIDEDGTPLPAPEIGYQPIGNVTSLVLRDNVAGDAVALIRRWLFDIGFSYSQDLTSFEDWQFYQRLHLAGHYGVVIPERLIRYRVRRDSMIRQIGLPETARLVGELSAHLREKEVEWTSRSD